MNVFRRILGGLKPSYLIRSYLIGLAFLALIIVMAANAKNENGFPVGMVAIAVLNTLLFPFAKLVWDELRDLAFGNNVIFMNAIFLFVLKLFINVFLWGLAIFIAPVGILYLWFRTRQTDVVG